MAIITPLGKAPLPLGQTVITPGALLACIMAGQSTAGLLNCHAVGDWGDLCAEDRQANRQALCWGTRVLSAYILVTGERIWVITEADRAHTTILLPSEY